MDCVEHIPGPIPNLASVATSADAAVILITRSFSGAARTLVWRCYTDPAHLVQFWGPKGATNPVCEIDLRVGGAWRQVMRFGSEQRIRLHQRLCRNHSARAAGVARCARRLPLRRSAAARQHGHRS